MSKDYSDTSLGRDTTYSDQYDPSLLFPISRERARDELGLDSNNLPFLGVDLWTGYELSWLNADGLPQVAIGEFTLPCSSANIIESKSFKLYLNSFNQSKFADWSAVEALLRSDLSQAAGAPVDVVLYQLGEFAGVRPIGEPEGYCLDHQSLVIEQYSPDAALLDADTDQHCEETLYSHLLRSNCPVTGQPDWASIYISYSGPRINREGLLRYLVAMRQHQDFHEQCVEAVFLDLMAHCRPQQLDVYARYTRRGGLDINPWRSTRQLLPGHFRQGRQ